MNFSNTPHNYDVSNIKYQDHMDQDQANRVVHSHVKKNLFDLTQGNSVVDITKLLGFDVLGGSDPDQNENR